MKGIYTSEKKFVDFVKEDAGIFLNAWEFARVHSIDGHEVICVLTGDKVQKGGVVWGENVSGRNMKLFARHEDISGFAVGQSVKVDDNLYIVKGVQNLQGFMWAVDLLSYSG